MAGAAPVGGRSRLSGAPNRAEARQGLRRGRTYPLAAAHHLLNPLRRVVEPPERIVRRMSLRPTDRVLEIGCGPGWFSPTLAAAVPLGMLLCTDGQQGMLQIAASRMAARAGVAFHAADAHALPFPDGSFEAVLLAHVLGETSEPAACLAEAVRVLSRGGALTVVETRRDSDFVPIGRLVDLAATAGLRLQSRRGPRWEYSARFLVASDLP